MKQANKITKISAAVVALVAVVGLSAASFAQNDESTKTKSFGQRFERMQLTEEEREEKRAEQEAAREAIDAAMASGYDAWVEAVTEHRGEDAPILEQITEKNFPALVEAHGYMTEAQELKEKAKSVLEEAGIEKPEGKFGKRGMGGRMGGMHRFGR